MLFVGRCLPLAFALSLAFLSAPAIAQAPQFSHSGVAKDAQRYEAWLKANSKPGARKARELRAAAEKITAARGDMREASRLLGMSVVADDRDADAWIGLARALLAIQPDPSRSSERYELPLNASAAAYTGYQRAENAALKSSALAVLGDALKKRSYFRPAIDALKGSLDLSENAEVRRAYEALRAEHGFRLVDYKLDTDAAVPRLCLQFSEQLARSDVDFAKFVSVGGKDPQGVTPEGKQLCIDGLAFGQRYSVQVRTGLPSDTGELLLKAADIGVYVRDRAPFVRFSGRNYVLPSLGQQGIPVVSVNTEKVAIEIYRLGDRAIAPEIASGNFQRQLGGEDLRTLKEQTGEKVFAGELTAVTKLNEEVTTAVPLGEAIPQLKPGVYAMIAEPADGKKLDDYESSATQWFIVSDFGLTAFSGDNGIHAFVRSLATTAPINDATVWLIAKNNDVLGHAKTDAAGYARFDSGLKRGEGGLAPALLVAEGASADYAFLDLTAAAFDLSDRGVKGREASGPLDAYLFSERGVYRPSEDVHLVALVRDAAGKASGVPMTLILTRPDGVEDRRVTLTDQDLGGRATTQRLAGSSMTGTWRAKLHADPKADPLAQIAFLVEDFVPERLELKLEPAAPSLAIEETGTINVAGRYLYGPPAAGLAIEGDIIVKASTKDVEGWTGYRFGLADEKINQVRKELEGLPVTANEGRAAVEVALPPVPKTSRPLEASVILRLREPGGRTIERSVSLPVDLKQPRVGIKPLFKNDQVPEGETANFEAVMLDAAGKRADVKALRWDLYRLDQSWQWYSRDGQWAYEAVTHARKAASGVARPDGDAPARIQAKVDYGRYRLEVTGGETSGPVSSVIFTAGWYADTAADSPEMLDVALDKASYKPGDTAKLRIASRQGGKALVAVLGNGLVSHKEVEIARGVGEIPVEVGADWGAGAYVTAVLYRPMDTQAKRMPGRALGIKWLPVDNAARTLQVALDVPARTKPGQTLSVPLRVTGLASGEEARITLAAVDVGILNLTRYQTPAPESWFYAQRKLGTEVRDYYGRLIDGLRAERGRLRSGGDGSSGMATEGSPPVEATLALFSGIVKVGADGTAKVDLSLPDFNGTVRLMAAAWSADKVGHGTADLIVRDKVALIASGPRFLTLGDEARLEVDVHNIEGPPGDYRIMVGSGSRGAVLQIVPFSFSEPGARKIHRTTLKAERLGPHEASVSVFGPDGINVKRTLTFDVKAPANDVKRTTVSQLAPGGKLTLSRDLLQDMLPARTRIGVSVGPVAALDVPALLTSLDRYPYGCAEQTVSRALPLLYANELASIAGLANDAALRTRVSDAIARVFEMQDASGAFGVWGPRNGDMWLTSYVTDFLSRAKESGYAVKPQALAQALDRLQSYVSFAEDFERGGEARAYALYVLARNGRAPIGELRYYVDDRLERFATPLAQAQLGAALAMLGDKERAEKAFRMALRNVSATDPGTARLDYGTSLRDGAALLTLASETRTARGDTPRLASVLAATYATRTYTSTQEQAWMVLAAKALIDETRDTALSVDGAAHKGQLNRFVSPAELQARAVEITNSGGVAVDTVVSVIGASLTPEPSVSKGFKVERSYYTLDGRKVDLKSASGGTGQLKQTDRLVAVLKIEATQAGGRVLLVDRLPAGLEIENPRLIQSADLKSFDFLKGSIKPEHTEFRDDRFVAAFNFFGKSAAQGAGAQADASDDDSESDSADASDAATSKGPVNTATVAYMVRAVTPGSFVHPAATVEDMYRPDRFARTASGRLEVSARE